MGGHPRLAQRLPNSIIFAEAGSVEIEANVLVALLAVRALGGRSAPADHEVIKALKKPIGQAVEKGLLKEETLTERGPAEAKKKPKTVKTKVVVLTEAGERALQTAASPEVLAATRTKALQAQLEKLRQDIDADRESLKAQLRTALAPKPADGGEKKLHAEAEKLSKAAEKLSEALGKVVQQVAKVSGDVAKNSEAVTALAAKMRSGGSAPPSAGDAPASLAAQVEAGFASLRARLDQALLELPKPAARLPAPPVHHPPASAEPAAKPPEPDLLQPVLRKAYETLCCFREFQEGMVELPRLYHEAKRARPALSVEEFQREILALESKRVADLHVRNEVRDAPEPEKAIRRNDKLYYYIYWPRP
jgi:hypothetical protein